MAKTIFPQESIYNYLPDQVHTEKPKYKSKFRPVLILKDKTLKDAMKTMGPAKVATPSPDKYLKKHSKEPKLPQIKERCHRMCTTKKPAVPLRSEHPPMDLHSKRSLIKPTTPVPTKQLVASVDTSRGHKELLEHSGLVPKYVNKKSYGKVPEYLQHRNEEVHRSVDEYNKYLKEQMEQGAMRQLSEEERQANLESLRTTLDELHNKYNRLPVVMDTLTRKNRKDQLEAEIKQLESDVGLFERFKTIYIAK
ncbi:enkurin [Hippocampus comes]|uniref:Enkurin, TRPC channel interacting protein n=1 Tax=Hippocampus comes TaxID=109280 RepID=A0A3Q2YZ39_HIPCM|nr:PREDICTED: enkurin [Hippocampus comes]